MTAAARIAAPEGVTLPTYADVERAAERLKGVAHHTPALSSATANRRTGASLVFKAENLQRMGAFKFRGGYNAISALTPEQKKAGVLTFSSGNHAQAIAYAGKLLGVPTTIIMPEDAPQAKVEATQGYGGEIIRYDRYTQDRLEIGGRLATERGLTLIPPFDHADVIAGQGTATKELIEDAGPFDMLFVCLGGGGLLAGAALAAKALNPECRIFGVEPEAGNDGQQSLRSGKIVRIGVPKTIADGAQTAFLGDLTFPIIQALVDDIVTVSDAELIDTMRFFAERMKLVVEPTGCLAAAAALTGKVPVEGKRVGVIISGGNVDLASYARFLASAE
ncbi:threo-3-hydroxy-L-aspartate ammonia-lyase [Bosea sp. Root381]|uniref:threo-3-hydroxy-L-aspartate ammonia-lyase n=1 Tax=Bosea sp. Root381 TaxID=1736524 RepID=UPI000A6F787C|nr:threo-3-hydroxy-L-aspartate ammonia-lyase [Bosea sp. Root381]